MCKVSKPGQFFSREAVVKLLPALQGLPVKCGGDPAPTRKRLHPLGLAAFRAEGQSSREVSGAVCAAPRFTALGVGTVRLTQTLTGRLKSRSGAQGQRGREICSTCREDALREEANKAMP